MSLAGKTVLVTRPKRQAAELSDALQALGATVYEIPAIEIVFPDEHPTLDEAISNLDRYDWVVFTSANGVQAFERRACFSSAALSGRKLAAIGPATAAALERVCRKPDLMPDVYVSEAMAAALGDVRGQKMLLPRADLARPVLAELLRKAGAEITEIDSYQISIPNETPPLPATCPDFITLTSSATVRGVVEILKRENREFWMSESKLVCIGEVTLSTVLEMGFQPFAVAEHYTVPGLIEIFESV